MVDGEPTPFVAGSALEGAKAELTARSEGVDDPWRSVGRIRLTRWNVMKRGLAGDNLWVVEATSTGRPE
jgi:hypothetical protein